MEMMNWIKLRLKYSIIFCVFLLVKTTTVKAQGFSYVYIQGDKKIPIYAKLEGVMLPRYGKNYALISRLAPGPMNVEILFQQNEYPAVQFNILVPENSKRGFVLTKKENEFYLYDVEQNFYLKPNNDIGEDHLPNSISNEQLAIDTKVENKTTEVKEENKTTDVIVAVKEVENTPDTIAITATKEPEVVVENKDPQFIGDITFDNENSTTTDTLKTETRNTTAATNTKCSKTIEYLPYIRLQNSINARKTEDEKLGLILAAAQSDCFKMEQTKELVEKLESDLARFSALKELYPKTIDQSEFSNLESLLTTDDWKSFFKDLVK